ncbi:uncharacterized protein LOC106087964 [Stomoxys calcitrans]|uniref:uncharacterized protein LOC106087964 n=1 Tax=Stomoxys calcitrans TaxID=35570 RepID=UPI0027E39632|nr:uncharacterized protein LOC106087964 [Stomoxys calcitrans]XP_059224446.1 uncharacterized protein LOC106087964 [Stomoxys calcitrans]XP_059224447.1 uncharacterized protein LOC106087964 [Stomoxys calcitrans]
MKLEPNVNGGSPLVTPLKISTAKVESIPNNETSKTDNEEDFDQFPDADEDLDDAGSSCVKNENGSEFSSVEETKTFTKVVEGIDNETAGETDESAVGKKKSRKKRSLNWEEAERGLLVEIIKPKVDFVENKSVDAKSIKSKRLAWLHVTKQFNALNFRHRSLEQIQVQWRSMKNSAKKEYQQKYPKATSMLDGMQMLEFMEEMQKEPAIGGTRSQTRNSNIQMKKEQLDDLDEEDDTPLAALPATLFNNTSNSEDTQPTSTLALSPSTSAESQNLEFQPLNNAESLIDVPVKKRKILPKLKEKLPKAKALHQAAAADGSGKMCGDKPVLGLKIKRQKCETTNAASSSLTDVSSSANTSLGVSSYTSASSTNLNANYLFSESKPSTAVVHAHNSNSVLTTPPPSPSACNDEKYKKQIFDLIRRARLAEIDFARKEHEQKLRHQQQEQDLKMRYMREMHEQRMRFAQMEYEARMRVYAQANEKAASNDTSSSSLAVLPDQSKDT